jgi:hypothetical protein
MKRRTPLKDEEKGALTHTDTQIVAKECPISVCKQCVICMPSSVRVHADVSGLAPP